LEKSAVSALQTFRLFAKASRAKTPPPIRALDAAILLQMKLTNRQNKIKEQSEWHGRKQRQL
jgi:hypothetical protein